MGSEYCDCHKIIPFPHRRFNVETKTINGQIVAKGEIVSVTMNQIDFHTKLATSMKLTANDLVYSRVKATGEMTVYLRSNIKIVDNKVKLYNVVLISEAEMRNEERVKVNYPIILSNKKQTKISGNAKDLSVNGMLVKSKEHLPLNTDVEVKMKILDDEVSMNYVVVRQMYDDYYGLKGNLKLEEKEMLQKLVSKYSYEKLKENFELLFER